MVVVYTPPPAGWVAAAVASALVVKLTVRPETGLPAASTRWAVAVALEPGAARMVAVVVPTVRAAPDQVAAAGPEARGVTGLAAEGGAQVPSRGPLSKESAW